MNHLERCSLQEKTMKTNINSQYNNDLLKPLNDLETQRFVENKINSRNNIIDTNTIIPEEEKSKIKENFQLFEQQVKNNKMLYDKYQWNELLFFRKFLDKLSEKNLLNQNKKHSLKNINDVKINFIWWDFVIEISDDDMDNFFWESFGWLTTPEIKIDWISIYPIVVRKNKERENETIRHELQHFYNKFLIKHSNEIEKVLLNNLADETIAQAIWWSLWQNAKDWKMFLAQCIAIWVQDWDPYNSYTFWNRFKLSTENQIALNQQIVTNLDNVDVARELRDAWIEDYSDILAITPIDKRNELRKYYLNK